MCECKNDLPSCTPASAMVNPTIFPSANAPSTCPPVSRATIKIAVGTKIPSLQVMSCSLRHSSYSASVSQCRTSTAAPAGLLFALPFAFTRPLPSTLLPASLTPTILPSASATHLQVSFPVHAPPLPSSGTFSKIFGSHPSMQSLDQSPKIAPYSRPQTANPPALPLLPPSRSSHPASLRPPTPPAAAPPPLHSTYPEFPRASSNRIQSVLRAASVDALPSTPESSAARRRATKRVPSPPRPRSSPLVAPPPSTAPNSSTPASPSTRSHPQTRAGASAPSCCAPIESRRECQKAPAPKRSARGK